MMTTAAGEDVAVKLLVRALRENTSKYGMEFEFHQVDLREKKIELYEMTTIPAMKGLGIGKLAKLDSAIYIVGNFHKADTRVMDQLKQLEVEEVDGSGDIHLHCFSSRWSLLSKRWETIKSPFLTNNWPNPATISAKLYCFGSPHLLPKLWNENDNDWKDLELPAHLVDRKVNTPVIVDHKNSRALVHFFDSDQIYAFYPNTSNSQDGEWVCLVQDFNRIWHRTVAVYDNILFIHHFPLGNLIEAYDLSTNESLKIDADFSRVAHATQSLFDAMFIVPKTNILCLATEVCSTPTRLASVHLIRFSFDHTSGTNVLQLTALDYQTYDITSGASVLDFLLL